MVDRNGVVMLQTPSHEVLRCSDDGVLLGKYEILNDLEYFLIHGRNTKGPCSNELETCKLVWDKGNTRVSIQDSIKAMDAIVKVRPSLEEVKLTDLNEELHTLASITTQG